MPDQHQPMTEPDTIPSFAKGKQKSSSATSTNPVESSRAETARTVHIVTNSKGGIGKSFVAGLVGQYLQDRGEPLICFDADTQNATLSDM
jgi:Mrp family chromosome partitioning ATPase